MGFFLANEVLCLHDFVLNAPGLAHDEQLTQRIQHHRIGYRCGEFDGVVVNLARNTCRVGEDAVARRGTLRALDREHHIVCGEVTAVVPFHTLAQVEHPHRRAGLFPTGGKSRHELQLLATQHQPVVNMAVHGRGDDGVLRVRVGAKIISLVGPSQRLRHCRHPDNGRDNGQEHDQDPSCFQTLFHLGQ